MSGPADPGMPRQRRVLHRGAKFDFELVTFAGADGRELTREVVRHPGSVVVVPLLGEGDDRRIVMIRNRRLALGRVLDELPAGTLEPPETPEACARRELEEETGYAAATLTPLGRFYTTPGMTDELMWAFVATGLRHVGQRLEADESLTVHPVPVGRALAMVESGELEDAKTMLAILLAARRGLL